MRVFRIFGLGVVLLALTTGDSGRVGVAQPDCTITVQWGQSIQRAIDQASKGAVICLDIGVFQENIFIDRDIILRGTNQEQTVIKGQKIERPVISIFGKSEINVVIERLTVSEAKYVRDWGDYDAQGIKITGKPKVILLNVQVSNNPGDGIVIGNVNEKEDKAAVKIMNVQVLDNGWNGLTIQGAKSVEIQDSVIRNNKSCGISVYPLWGTQLLGPPNEIRDNGTDLCGYVPAVLRKPLVPTTTRTLLSVPDDFKSIQEAIDAIAPGGTIMINTGVYEAGITIWKPVILVGAGREQTIIQPRPQSKKAISILAEAKNVTIKDLTVRGIDSRGVGMWVAGQSNFRNIQTSSDIFITDSAVVDITDSWIFNGFGVNILGLDNLVRVKITNSQITDNKADGLSALGIVRITLRDSDISRNNRDGLSLRGPLVELTNTRVGDNKENGIYAAGITSIIIMNSIISGNDENGIEIAGEAAIEVSNSNIVNNGIGECRSGLPPFIPSLCNGILVMENGQLLIGDSVVQDNADWGIAVWHRSCGYPPEYGSFRGQVFFEEQNTIQGNNRSGNLNGMGNPGNHYWNRPDIPDGQVCLP